MDEVRIEPTGQARAVNLETDGQATSEILEDILMMVKEEEASIGYCVDQSTCFVAGDAVVLDLATGVNIEGEPLVGALADNEEYPGACMEAAIAMKNDPLDGKTLRDDQPRPFQELLVACFDDRNVVSKGQEEVFVINLLLPILNMLAAIAEENFESYQYGVKKASNHLVALAGETSQDSFGDWDGRDFTL